MRNYDNLKIMRKAIKTIRYSLLLALLAIISMGSSSDPNLNDGSLYSMDLEDESTCTISCYENLTGSTWSVKNQTCTLSTSVINIPGDPASDPNLDIPINFCASKTGNLEAEDNVTIEFSLGGEWFTVDVIDGTALTSGVSEYGYRADNVIAGSTVQFRFIAKTNDNSEKITLHFNTAERGVFVGTPFFTGTNDLFRSGVLPVSLADFYAQPVDGQVDLIWTTLSENNNQQFEVERSTNGVDFNTVTIVPGNGNSNSAIEYKATDYSPLEGTSYYRLKQVDFDGKFAYSTLISVISAGDEGDCVLKTTPNPCLGKCSFVMENCPEDPGTQIKFHVYDALGNIVYAQSEMLEPGSSTFAFDGQNGLKPGVYIVRGQIGEKNIEDKFMLQN
jgi:hypothetical protein